MKQYLELLAKRIQFFFLLHSSYILTVFICTLVCSVVSGIVIMIAVSAALLFTGFLPVLILTSESFSWGHYVLFFLYIGTALVITGFLKDQKMKQMLRYLFEGLKLRFHKKIYGI